MKSPRKGKESKISRHLKENTINISNKIDFVCKIVLKENVDKT